MKRIVAVLAFLASGSALAQTNPATKQVLYLTRAASYFHRILPYSVEAMKQWAARDGKCAVDCTGDCAVVTPDNPAKYDCLIYYTNRELPITESNCQAILDSGYTTVWWPCAGQDRVKKVKSHETMRQFGLSHSRRSML